MNQQMLNYNWFNKPQNLLYRYRVFDTEGKVIGTLCALIIYDCHKQNQWVAVLSQYGGFNKVSSTSRSEYLEIPFYSDCEEKISNRIAFDYPDCQFQLQV